MKTKKKYAFIFVVALLLLLGVALSAWYFAPKTFLKRVNAAEVASIAVMCGSTGERFEITDPAEIAHIVTNIQSTEMRRDSQ